MTAEGECVTIIMSLPGKHEGEEGEMRRHTKRETKMRLDMSECVLHAEFRLISALLFCRVKHADMFTF